MGDLLHFGHPAIGLAKHVRHAAGEIGKEGRLARSQLGVQRLRDAGAAGATSLRGIWGYHGDHTPHGDSFWQLRRRVPVVCVVVDTPRNIQRWFAIVDELTAETGVVTSELVPAYPSSSGRQ